MVDSGHIVQITNVSPGATSEQLKALFGHLGTVEEIELYPKMQDAANPITRMAYVKFTETSSVDVAQHLTNTVFVDRALICVPFAEDIIPEESVAMQLPANVPAHAIPPSVVPTVDPAKLDEIQRTVYVGNLDSKTVTAEKLMTFFTDCGDVRFVRLAGDETQPTRFAFVEFGTTEHVLQAIMMNGMLFCERPIKINHSNNAIVKPPGKSADAREIDEAMRRVREAQSLIAKALEPEKGKPVKKPRTRSRSRSRHRRRRSKSRDRSRHHRRSHSRSRSSRRRSRSRSHDRRRSSHRRSRSRDRRRKRSHSHGRKSSRSPHKKSSSSSSKSHRKKDDRKRDRDHRSKRSKHDKDSGDDRRSKKQKKKDDDSGSSSSHRDKDENTTTANGDHAPPSATPTEEVKQEVAA